MILVKNEGVLPVTDHSKKIVVIGPNGNGLRILNGSYTQPADFEMMLYMINQIKAAMPGFDLTKAADAKKKEEKGQEAKKSNLADLKVGCPVSKPNPEDLQELIESSTRKMAPGSKTVFEALKEIYPNTAYCRGCYLNNNEKDDINAAALAAEKADVAVLVLGGKNGWGADCTSGEGLDNMDIRLTGRQEELALAVLKANSNTVVVHIDSHPLVSPSIYEKAGAVIECFFPGPFGGIAVAKTISGENNPGGRLCVDVPRHVGQTPLYYYQHNGSRSDLKVINTTYDGYVDGKASAQYPFGYGLSYTQFSYAKPELNAKTGQDKIPVLTASINVKNTGKVTGDEVVMLFGQNEFASKVRPQKELIGFKRVTLKPGEEKRVSLTFRLDQLSFPIENEKWVLEKGKFNFAFCKNADEPLFSLEYNMEQDLVIDHTRRGFYAQAVVKSL
jgi:beta-glucosidase